MKLNVQVPGIVVPRVPSGSKARVRTALVASALAAFCGVAVATEGEKYPDWGSSDVEGVVENWRAEIVPLVPKLCTGKLLRSGSQSTRDPVNSTPNVPAWTPLDQRRTDGASQFESHAGGDTDSSGTDSYLYVKLVGLRANLFCKVILEAEDGAQMAWSVRYKGEETLQYVNGPVRKAEKLSIRNPWSIGWSRRIVDFDAVNGEYDEAKAIDQGFAVRVDLIDGSSAGDAATFHRVVPKSQSSTTSAGLKLKGGGKVGAMAGGEFGAELGFEASTTETYDTDFHQLVDQSASLGHSGVASVNQSVPCPFAKEWVATTQFDGDFSIYDHANGNGDQGSRQELLLTVTNYVSSFEVAACHFCGARWREPIDPPTWPTPTTPTTPGAASTPTQGVVATPPTGPVITPDTGPEPGSTTQGVVETPPTGPVITPDTGPEPGSTSPTTGSCPTTPSTTPGPVITPAAGHEPGWGGTPPATAPR